MVGISQATSHEDTWCVTNLQWYNPLSLYSSYARLAAIARLGYHRSMQATPRCDVKAMLLLVILSFVDGVTVIRDVAFHNQTNTLDTTTTINT